VAEYQIFQMSFIKGNVVDTIRLRGESLAHVDLGGETNNRTSNVAFCQQVDCLVNIRRIATCQTAHYEKYFFAGMGWHVPE